MVNGRQVDARCRSVAPANGTMVYEVLTFS